MKLKNSIYAVAFTALGFAVACTPDEVTGGNPITGPELDAGFTATVSEQMVSEEELTNTVTISLSANSNDPDVQYHLWRISNKNGEFVSGSGKGDYKGDTFVYTLVSKRTPQVNASGTYIIRHTAVGFIGGNNSVSEQTFTIDLPVPEDPNGDPEFGPNVIASPNFENAADWMIFQTSNEAGVTWTINGDSATASGGTGNYPGAGIWQAVTLEAGEYMLDMHVSGAGSTDTWFEVYVGSVMPQDQTDYTGDFVLGLNTWNNCGNTAFDGLLSEISCVGTQNPVTIPADGTYYFVIKTGSGADNGVNNITVTDVTLKKVL